MKLQLNTTITNLPYRLWQACENYLHINQTSYKITKIEDRKIFLLSERTRSNYIYLALKILSYATIIFPLLALAIKGIYRQVYTYHVTEKTRVMWLNPPPFDSGMFSVFSMVAGFLHKCEKSREKVDVFKIDFKDKGLYYDEAKGPNWWNYYFESVIFGDLEKLNDLEKIEFVEYNDDDYVKNAWMLDYQLKREQVHSIINKYIKIRPTITQQVEDFVNKEFKDFHVIGVHYRGTDKKFEAPLIQYETIFKKIKEQIQKLPTNYKIFVATDDQSFLDYIKKALPGKIIEKDNYRSTDGKPVHMCSQNRFKQGEQAIIDALLLAKTRLLMRTSSNLSLWSTYFNPSLPVIEFSKRYGFRFF